ncbi:hypothetical protein [Sunxiuqinia indica]|uniref:hypothetical protein n=1 Tax=Sunxiuqinia indica TaxID=2692584 RepID=UPI001357B749|nr:hypothetical protein [Sunxiuqinia indica]
MKKVMIITAAVAIMGISVPAASVLAGNAVKAKIVAQQDVKYEKIDKEDLPEAVSKSISEGYADYTISEAFKGTDGSFKVKLENGSEKLAIFFNEQGEFLKIKKEDQAAPME